MPGDGTCLFHSLAFGLRTLGVSDKNGHSVRKQVASFISERPNLEVAGTPLRSWVDWDSRTSVSDYAARIFGGGWGGAIEMAACTALFGVDVAVYEEDRRTGFKRISDFRAEGSPRGACLVLYSGRSHYDALAAYEVSGGSATSDRSQSCADDEEEWPCSLM